MIHNRKNEKINHLLELNENVLFCTPYSFRDVVTEIKQDHFYGRGYRDDMISILNCADGLSGISGCEMSMGCTSGVGLSIRCRTYVS